ncbi:hypothetical protein I3843_10G002000 [Carya illinoinensis]|uniref:PWWP domain-containing protein n=1 Tax=Carya illinoinensis TaxID=32201 RepID=A0A8T1P8X8_CARIL|nr:uncharacterized protein LOC122278023 isoform X3 [Carya illinoinensis]KAG2682808.1 hypothetical protein I3760_10G002100 [Carya illinoinensis]KAG2682809.1 hypothetical protein I3760_10G002100 [Carya illinoinensis]KAG2682810.1 hypothetical protein I3760_10G002100 [Carya illinoinensis]KAG6637963.1 hypothetical protein CIPAW_10G001900 [Carya illinoinensis]KAG6690190.1 hypothetical protein I3842_10G002100 [Carya illinoinensis]
MANNKKKTTNSPKLEQIDNLPYYYSQKPRSSQPKRRSDFSSFFYSAPLYNSGSLPGSSCGEVGLSNVTMNSLNDRNAEGEQLPEHPLVQCCKFQDKELRFSSDFSETLTVEVETVAQNELFDTLSERNVGEQTSDTARSVECTPSHATETNGFCITPGSVVWARTASHMWWPAKITDRRYNSADTRNQDTGGRVLVEFYGSNDIAWLDPTRDLSQLEDCFEERSCNPMEDFQDALKQALQGKECLSSCGELFKSPDDLNDSDQQYHSSQKWTSSISCRAEDDFLERGRGKRERKRKLHFDEVTFPLMSAKKVRRFRIMRYLGLSAPIGSPFFIN